MVRGVLGTSRARWIGCALVALACGGNSLHQDGSGGDGDGGSSSGGTPNGGQSSGGADGTGGQSTGGQSAGGQSAGGQSTGGQQAGGTGGEATGGLGGDASGGLGGEDGGGGGGGEGDGCTSCLDDGCGECPDNPMVYVEDGNYWIDSTEVTNSAYADFLAAQPSSAIQPAQCSFNGTYVPTNQWPATDRADHAVAWVDWCDAYAYCAWAGKRLCGAIDGGATPYASFKNAAVSQWYNACSAGGTVVYPYGSDYDAEACNGGVIEGESSGDPWPAGSQASCQGGVEGLFDMSGNLWEWEDSCATSDGVGDLCRARGGSFWSSDLSLRCQGATADHSRSNVNRNLGFRCCSDGD